MGEANHKDDQVNKANGQGWAVVLAISVRDEGYS